MIENQCRVCLEQESSLLSIFTIDLGFGISYADIINISISSLVHITQDDGLPEKICRYCSQKIAEFHKFKLNIEKNDLILKSERENLRVTVINIDSICFSQEQTMKDKKIDLGTSFQEVDVKCYQAVEELENIKQEPLHHELTIKNEVMLEENVNRDEDDQQEISEKFPQQNEQEDPLLIHTSEKKAFACQQCNKKFARSNDLKRHSWIHTGKRAFECERCSKKFTQKRHLQTHLLIHTSKHFKFQCEQCNKTFTQKTYLQAHLLRHTTEKHLKCEQCNRKFSDRSTLRRHLLIHKSGKLFKFTCEDCGIKFSKKYILQKHLLLHTGEKQYKCEQCNKIFTHENMLSNHILLIHKSKQLETSFECHYCNKKYTLKKSLQTHLISHAGGKRYECEACHKKFARSNDLKRHLLLHSGEKPFTCEQCNKLFRYKSSLRKHTFKHIKTKVKVKKEEITGGVD